jgi:hypothetical protein
MAFEEHAHQYADNPEYSAYQATVDNCGGLEVHPLIDLLGNSLSHLASTSERMRLSSITDILLFAARG